MKLTKVDFFIVDDGIMIKCDDGKETELEQQILDDHNVWNMVDMVLEKTATITDIIDLVKENKQLKEDLKNSASKEIQLIYQKTELKQKLEKIQKLVDDDDFLVTRRQLKEILEEYNH